MLALDLNYNNFNVKSNYFPTDHSTDIAASKIILCIWKYTDLLLLSTVYTWKFCRHTFIKQGVREKKGRESLLFTAHLNQKKKAFYQCSTILFGRLTLGYTRKKTLSGVCCITLGSLPVMNYQQIFFKRQALSRNSPQEQACNFEHGKKHFLSNGKD